MDCMRLFPILCITYSTIFVEYTIRNGCGFSEKEKANYKHQAQYSDSGFRISRKLGRNADNGGTKESGTLSEDVKKAEVFARFFFRYNFSIVRAGERLDRPLKYRDTNGKEPKFPSLVKLQGK